MNEDIKNSIIILALNNLLIDYESALEITRNNQNSEVEPEYIQFIIDTAKLVLMEFEDKFDSDHTISRPIWNKQK
jgi:hypothetical protein